MAEPTWRSSSEQSALERMSELERFVHGLSDVQRTAFEDEVLRRVRADDKWKKVHDRYPQRMPAMMTYANNAYLREVGHPARPPAVPPEMQEVRSRWERPASRRQPGVPDVTGVSYPGVNEMSDGLAFREAA
ncbi:hypothetical protein ACIRPX_13585, partial [Streptomyces sp. NPDC101225]|uniref:hypothetical protein n=1 Tax=Streptomyces sp. NPDC101225 TaxID=3366135 RepID=UPI0038082693